MEIRQNISGSSASLVESYLMVVAYSSLPVAQIKQASVIQEFDDGTLLEYDLRGFSICNGKLPWDASEVLTEPRPAPAGTLYTPWYVKLDASFAGRSDVIYKIRFIDINQKKYKFPLNKVRWETWVQPPHMVSVWAEASGVDCPARRIFMP